LLVSSGNCHISKPSTKSTRPADTCGVTLVMSSSD
jgi:hypothetical protein